MVFGIDDAILIVLAISAATSAGVGIYGAYQSDQNKKASDAAQKRADEQAKKDAAAAKAAQQQNLMISLAGIAISIVSIILMAVFLMRAMGGS